MNVFSTSRLRPRIGRSGALRIEIDLLAGEIAQALNLRPNEDMQLGREQIQDIRNSPLDVRHLALVLLERVGVDDCGIDASQIEQGIHVFSGPSGDHRQDMEVVPIVDHTRDLRRQADRRALEKTSGQADRPGVHGGHLRPWLRRLGPCQTDLVRPNVLRPRIRPGLNGQEQ
jgi:hypothetical protein